jgi:hypothetical protein
MVFCYKKIAAYESEIRFDPSIPDLGDLAIPHAIVCVNKLFKLFQYHSLWVIMTYFVACIWQNENLLMNIDMQKFNILNKTKTIAL